MLNTTDTNRTALGPSAPTPASVQFVDPQLAVIRLDIYICAAITFAVLLRLPRVWGRIWNVHEWRSGHILRHTRPEWQQHTPERHRSIFRKASCSSIAMEKEDLELESNMSHTACNHGGQRFDNHEQSMESSYPPHIAACPSILWPFSDLLTRRIFISYSNVQVLIILGYLSLLLYTFLYHNNAFVHPVRAGWIVVSQLPFLFLFATRNNILAWLLGLDFQHFNYLHRFLGRVIVAVANIHAIGFFYKWSLEDGISAHLNTPNIWGMIALVCFNIIFLSSTSYWRTKAYNIFLLTHVSCYLISVPAIYNHRPSSLPFIIALSVPYSLDHALRLLKTRLATASVHPLPSMDATRIEIQTLNTGWRAGQYVRLRVLSTSLGWFRWTESHPFTIAAAPVHSEKNGIDMGNRGLVLICKNTGAWTQRLFDAAKKRNTSLYVDSGAGIGRSLKVLIEGPYGGPGHSVFSSYSAVVLVIGGSGITFALSVIQDLVQKNLRAESRVRSITLVWVVHKPDALTPLLPLFVTLVTSFPALSISVRYTRAYSMKINRSESTPPKKGRGRSAPNINTTTSNSPDSSFPVIPQNIPISLNRGRPSKAELTGSVENTITSALNLGNDTLTNPHRRGADQTVNGLLVGICGPTGMGKDVRDVVNDIHLARKYQVGGIEIHEESFGW